MAVAFPPPLVPIAGASDREGRSRRNRHHWIAPSRGIIPIFWDLLVLDHRGAPGLQHRAFFRKSTVRQCNTAPGRRWERSGACAMAVPTGQGVGRAWRPPAPRVEHARPFFDEFWRFGPDKGTSIVFGQATRAAETAAARVVEGVSAVRATHPVRVTWGLLSSLGGVCYQDTYPMYRACIVHVSRMYLDVSRSYTSRYIEIHRDTFVSSLWPS
jgi:hypothetical protein